MHEEEQFFTLLEQVRREAKEKNNSITKERIRDIYKEMGLKEEQLSFLYDFLEKEHIKLGAFFPSLENDKRESLLEKAMAGDKEAEEKALTLFLEDIPSIARLYENQGADCGDLEGEGYIALLTGMKRIETCQSPKEAEGFLILRIMDAMEEFLSEQEKERNFHIELADKLEAVHQCAKELWEIYMRKISPEEVASELHWTPEEVREALYLGGVKIECMTG
ncbi:MAG: hypothetical protein HFI78_04425 [Lachnospiraceae bacterium]|jgi:DNA-directed RNA polymerase specialized sigma subunit|nr:hypothetical protein [Lachnospiraceae bacterium]